MAKNFLMVANTFGINAHYSFPEHPIFYVNQRNTVLKTIIEMNDDDESKNVQKETPNELRTSSCMSV